LKEKLWEGGKPSRLIKEKEQRKRWINRKARSLSTVPKVNQGKEGEPTT